MRALEVCIFFFFGGGGTSPLGPPAGSAPEHPFVINLYPQNSKLCIIDCEQEFKSRTDLVRENLDEIHKNYFYHWATH